MVFALVSCAGVLALAGCTMVSDTLTGVSLNRTDPTTCIKSCNDSFKLQYFAEQKKHLEEVARCQALSQPNKNACLTAEAQRHAAAMEALGAAKVECHNNCHQQGEGGTG